MSKTVMFILAISVLGGVYHFMKPDSLPVDEVSVGAANLDVTDSNSSSQEVVDGYEIERRKRDEEDKEVDITRLNDLMDEMQEKKEKRRSETNGQSMDALMNQGIKSKSEQREESEKFSEAMQLCIKIYKDDQKKLGECENEVVHKMTTRYD